MMIPPVGEQDTADIQKQRRARDRSLHLAAIKAVSHLDGSFVVPEVWRWTGGPGGSVRIFPKRFLARGKQVLWRFARGVDGQMPPSLRRYGGQTKSTASAPALNIR